MTHSRTQGQCQRDSAGVQGKGEDSYLLSTAHLSPLSNALRKAVDRNPALTQWCPSPSWSCLPWALGRIIDGRTRGVSLRAFPWSPAMPKLGDSGGQGVPLPLLNRWEHGGLGRCRDETRTRPPTLVNKKATRDGNVK